MRAKSLAAFAVAAGVLGSLHGAASAQYILLGNDWSDGTIHQLNQSTGAVISSVPASPIVQNLTGIAQGGDGLLYGLMAGMSSELHTIDPFTGASLTVGATGKAFVTEGDVDFDPITGTLFAVQETAFGSNDRSLFTVDPGTGTTVEVGVIATGPDISAMAFDAAGDLWVMDTAFTTDTLHQVNKSTGAIISSVTMSGGPLGATAGMDFHPDTGVLYVADGFQDGTDALYTLDTGTGALTLVGPTGLANGVAGLEFIIPEPTSLLLLAIGGALVLRRRIG